MVPLCFLQLLVNNKIISLDLSVAEVYKKVWCPTNEVGLLRFCESAALSLHASAVLNGASCCLFFKGEPMRIIYRMRGLLGDATEEFIESLDSTTG